MELDLIMVGKRIKQARNMHKLTQAELAERLEVSTSYIGMMERALNNVTLDNLVKLSNILETPVAFFVQDSLIPQKDTDIDTKIINELNSLSDSQKEFILDTIMGLKNFCQKLINGILK